MKNPPMAHTLDTDDFCRYLFSLERERESETDESHGNKDGAQQTACTQTQLTFRRQ